MKDWWVGCHLAARPGADADDEHLLNRRRLRLTASERTESPPTSASVGRVRATDLSQLSLIEFRTAELASHHLWVLTAQSDSRLTA